MTCISTSTNLRPSLTLFSLSLALDRIYCTVDTTQCQQSLSTLSLFFQSRCNRPRNQLQRLLIYRWAGGDDKVRNAQLKIGQELLYALLRRSNHGLL